MLAREQQDIRCDPTCAVNARTQARSEGEDPSDLAVTSAPRVSYSAPPHQATGDGSATKTKHTNQATPHVQGVIGHATEVVERSIAVARESDSAWMDDRERAEPAGGQEGLSVTASACA